MLVGRPLSLSLMIVTDGREWTHSLETDLFSQQELNGICGWRSKFQFQFIPILLPDGWLSWFSFLKCVYSLKTRLGGILKLSYEWKYFVPKKLFKCLHPLRLF